VVQLKITFKTRGWSFRGTLQFGISLLTAFLYFGGERGQHWW